MKRKYTDNHSIIQMCIRKLKKLGLTTIDGKELHYCTYPMVSTYFEKKFGYNPLNNDIKKTLSKNKYSNRTDEFIYFITTKSEEFCKIGYCNNPEEVLIRTQKVHPEKVHIYALFRGNSDVYENIKSIYEDLHVRNKWFKFKDTDLKNKIDSIKKEFEGLDRPFLQVRDNDIFTTNSISAKNLKLYILLNKEGDTCKRIITTDLISYFDTEDWEMVFKREYYPHVRKSYLKVKMNKYSKYLIPGSTNLYKYKGILQRDIMNNDL